MCGSGDFSSAMSSMSKNSAPGMCSARYSALASRLAVGRCMEPSRMTRPGVSRCEASQSVSTSHFPALSSHRASLPPAQANATRMRRFSLPFFSILVTATGPISPVRLHVRAAAGLQVDRAVLADDDEAHAAGAHRRLHGHGAHELRVGLELGVGDPALADGMIGGDQRVEVGGQLVLVDGGGVLDVEVEPAVVGVDLAAGDRKLHERAEQVQQVCMRMRRERVSQSSTARTLWPGAGRRRALGGHVHDGGLVGVVDGGGDRAAAAAVDLERALVAGLPAGGGIEHGAVEHDAAALVDGQHARGAVAQVGIGPVELLGHFGSPRASGPRPSTTGRKKLRSKLTMQPVASA